MREIKGASSILKTMIHHVLTKYLMKKKVATWWVPHMLFPTQEQCHMELRQKHLTPLQKESNCVFATNNHYR